MTEILEKLRRLQVDISQRNLPDMPDDVTEKLTFVEVHGLLHVEFYASPFDESFTAFCDLLSESEVAAKLRSLSFRGPDEGANGTRNWDFTSVLASGVEFPNLLSFFVEPTAPEHHNQTILAEVYEEEGMAGQLLARMPALQSLTVPSAPDATFFSIGARPLVELRVDSGYDHQDFLLNLSQTDCFSQLRVLDFGDYNLRLADEYPTACTPFPHYEALIKSPALPEWRVFIVRNAPLSGEQFRRLRYMRKNLTLHIIQQYGEYL
jgi:hypothetical protein